MKAGLVKSALDTFEEAGFWCGTVECLINAGRNAKAEEMIGKKLKVKEEPYLWCLLGDIKKDAGMYTKAWEMSKGTFPRAQRLLAQFYLSRKEYKLAIPALEHALGLNPMFPKEWYSLGCCYLDAENFPKAVDSFV
jgi:tetratricopeptide (TPR) repeat protein